MRPAYFEGFAKHLLERSGDPAVASVETFAEAGAKGQAWAPHGLKVTGSDGQAVFLSFARTSAFVGDADDAELVFDPEVLDVPALRHSDVG